MNQKVKIRFWQERIPNWLNSGAKLIGNILNSPLQLEKEYDLIRKGAGLVEELQNSKSSDLEFWVSQSSSGLIKFSRKSNSKLIVNLFGQLNEDKSKLKIQTYPNFSSILSFIIAIFSLLIIFLTQNDVPIFVYIVLGLLPIITIVSVKVSEDYLSACIALELRKIDLIE